MESRLPSSSTVESLGADCTVDSLGADCVGTSLLDDVEPVDERWRCDASDCVCASFLPAALTISLPGNERPSALVVRGVAVAVELLGERQEAGERGVAHPIALASETFSISSIKSSKYCLGKISARLAITRSYICRRAALIPARDAANACPVARPEFFLAGGSLALLPRGRL